MAATTSTLATLVDTTERALDLLGDTSGVVVLSASACLGDGIQHVMVGTDDVETLARLVSDLLQHVPVAQILDGPGPAWTGTSDGLRFCLYVHGVF